MGEPMGIEYGVGWINRDDDIGRRASWDKNRGEGYGRVTNSGDGGKRWKCACRMECVDQ